MKKTVFSFLGILLAATTFGQKVWLDDPDNFDPEQPTKIWFDIKACDCQRLLGTTDPVYIWTWNPSDADQRDPANANGDWTASNPNMTVTPEGDDTYSWTITPTEFYNVSKDVVYAKGFSMLLKLADGTGDGGGGCDEDKTENLELTPPPPPVTSQKIIGFPSTVQSDDIFTVVYNNNDEEKASMQNLTDDEVYVWAQATTTDSVDFQIETFFQVPTNPNLRMTSDGAGTFTLTIVPEEFFADATMQGKTIQTMTFVVRKKDYLTLDDRIDEDLVIEVGCP